MLLELKELNRQSNRHRIPDHTPVVNQFGSGSQSWKWEPKAKNSAPIELLPGAVCQNGSGYSRYCVRAE